MKIKLLFLTSFLVILFSCKKEAPMPADFYMEVRDYVEERAYTFGNEQPLYLWSTKSWADKSTSRVEYFVDETVLTRYNSEHNTSLKLLPESCYRLGQTVFDIPDEIRNAKFKAYYTPEKIIAAGGQYDKVEYALPFRIKVNGKAVDDKFGTVLIGFKIMKPYLNIEETDRIETFILGEPGVRTFTFAVSTKAENKRETAMDFSFSPLLVQHYNTLHGTNYHALAAEMFYFWNEDAAVLPEGVSEKRVSFMVDMKDIQPDTTLLPVQLSGAANGFIINENQNKKFIKLVYIPRTASPAWKVDGYSSTIEEGNPDYIIDNKLDYASFWHANWGGTIHLPQWITIKLRSGSRVAEVAGVDIYTRQGNTYGKNGAKKAEILLSMDGVSWETAATHEFPLDNEGRAVQACQTVYFKPTLARYVKLNVTEKYDDGICFQEIYVRGKLKTI